MQNTELKLCPFCGGKAVVHVKSGVQVICKECGVMTKCLVDGYSQGMPTGGAIESVVKAWNRRV
jgi:Lar family restriction alleviation protein|nr:MAG TPA: restriction alleviation protein [Caudoviricetes sp.]